MDGAKEEEEKKRTYMNKCPYEWRLTFNIQKSRSNKNTHTHTHAHISRDYLKKTKIKE
jgi:hypothetical protein